MTKSFIVFCYSVPGKARGEPITKTGQQARAKLTTVIVKTTKNAKTKVQTAGTTIIPTTTIVQLTTIAC